MSTACRLAVALSHVGAVSADNDAHCLATLTCVLMSRFGILNYVRAYACRFVLLRERRVVLVRKRYD